MKNKIEKELFKMADETYAEFHRGIVNDDIPIIGVRLPKLREYAKSLSKKDTLEFLLENIKEDYYEEILLKGILIGLYPKLSFEEVKKYIQYYVPKIRNWALCDSFCSSLKITKKYKSEIWKTIEGYLKSSKEFDVRFALVMILNYYIEDEYIKDIFKIINHVTVDEYYTKMANAWLISYCFIKYYDETLEFYQNNCQIDTWTYHKGIQKAIESYRLTKEQKDELKKLRKY
ncbi:MAG: DNA alkylation repair protein [Clostridia bacterium]|nr:DNA alkylation repair protein [Clostridia bacterium]